MKTKKQKIMEYDSKYCDVPRDLNERLNWLYTKLKIDDKTSQEILNMRQNFLYTSYYKTIKIVIYEVPEHTPRPRARLLHRKDVINAATGNNTFIQVYSITGRQNQQYMKMLMADDLVELDHLLCTPCDIEINTYFPTPSYYNRKDIFMAEIGLDRPISKPDFDNIEKAYGDMFTNNIWIDDILVIDASFHKFYSVLPRVEINLHYLNHLYNRYQYNAMIKRKDYNTDFNVQYFNGR